MNLRAILRSLRRAPLFAAAVVCTLALGIGATASIFSVVDAVLLRPLPYHDSDRLVALRHSLLGIGIPTAGQSLGTYFHYRRTSHTLSSVAGYVPAAFNLSDAASAAEPERIRGALISANLLPTLGISPARGRNFTEQEDRPRGPNLAMLGESLWRRRYGSDPSIIGRAIQVNGSAYTVVGVLPATFHFPDPTTDLWLPLQLDPATTDAGGFNMGGVGRLAANVTIADAERELNQLLGRMAESYPNIYPGMPTAPLFAQARARAVVSTMKEQAIAGFARILWIVVATVGLVLVVMCANVANLMLVRAQSRGREIAVRSALGASRGSLLARFLGEGLVLAGAGAVAGLALAAVAIRLLVQSGASDLPRLNETGLDVATVAFTALVAVVVALVCSALPALRFRRASVSALLREGGRTGTAGQAQQRVQHTLVVVQVALAMLLLAGSGLLMRTVAHLRGVRPGFDPSNTIAFTLSVPTGEIPHSRDAALFYQSLIDRIAALPGVHDVGVVSKLPLVGGESLAPVHIESQPTEGTTLPPVFPFPTATPSYFAAMHIPLIAGRIFAPPTDPAAEREVVVSRAFAERFWHDPTGVKALGQRIRVTTSAPWSTIVGVVESVRDSSLTAEGIGEVYTPLVVPPPDRPDSATSIPRVMSVVVRTPRDPATVVPAIRRAVSELHAGIPIYDVQPMRDVLVRWMAQTSFVLVALGAAAAITLVLGAVGLYGVIAYSVSLRTRELGVRMALGAAPRAIRAMILGEGLLLAIIGVGIGLAAFLGIGRVLRRLLFEVGAADPVTLGATTAMLLAISLFAAWLPARRAARADPLEALRAE
ncbi:MAG TPA: ABC transporter permease [Gemmatimonadaceae bacterium]|nr:ABC transporter permease [Gemmatimonadaceae bacterium]